MSIFLFANNASSTLAAPISNTATSVTLAAGTGAEFPSPSAGQQFGLTFNDAATGLLTEIVYCTARTGDTLTIARAQEGTTAQGWASGDLAANLWTAGVAAAMQQTSALFPARIINASGPFTITTADAAGGIGLNRVVAPAVSSAPLPNGASAGQTYDIADLAGNFNAFPVTISAPGGQSIAGGAAWALNVNRQTASFRYYGSNIWGVKT
jgi:hypothetical protein